MNFASKDLCHCSWWRWAGLCFATAFILGLHFPIDSILHPGSVFFLPDTFNDSLIYTALIQKCSDGLGRGDPFLWEHRNDPASLFSFLHFWPVVFGYVYSMTGHTGLVVVSLLLSGLWFFALFLCFKQLGHPDQISFFLAGVQSFFVVNLAYQIVGFKTNFSLYTFWVTEHVRLYPTVVAMAVYCLSTCCVLALIKQRSWKRVLAASISAGLVVYGRPFDWMVLMMALGLYAAFCFINGDRKLFFILGAVIVLAVLGALPFLKGFAEYQSQYHLSYVDQMARGNLQIKNISHYVKYFLLCLLVLVPLYRWLRSTRKNNIETPEEKDPGALRQMEWFIYALVASSFLIHFKTALEGGVTLVGFAYSMVFSAIPWTFMLVAHLVAKSYEKANERFGTQSGWVTVLFLLLVIQQVGMLTRLRDQYSKNVVAKERLEMYQWIRDSSAVSDPVVLSLDRGVEVQVFGKAWSFIPTPAAASYACSAPTTELLERYLLSKLILTGTISDLQALFSPQGMPSYLSWKSKQITPNSYWIALLEQVVGQNTFIIHPVLNQGELKYRKIELPENLRNQQDFVAYFDEPMRRIYESCSAFEGKPEEAMKQAKQKYRLDFIYVSAEKSACAPAIKKMTSLVETFHGDGKIRSIP